MRLQVTFEKAHRPTEIDRFREEVALHQSLKRATGNTEALGDSGGSEQARLDLNDVLERGHGSFMAND